MTIRHPCASRGGGRAPRSRGRQAAAPIPPARAPARAIASSSTVPTGASARRVARSRNSSAWSRCSASVAASCTRPRTVTSQSIGVLRDVLEVLVAGEHGRRGLRAPAAGGPGKPSALSPTSASQSGIEAGRHAELRAHARPRRETRACGGRAARPGAPTTHCARSLSGVQIDAPARPRRRRRPSRAAAASASSASSSTIAQTTTPSAASASSSSGNCAQQRRVDALARLVAGPEVVAERLDDVVGGHAEVGGAALEHAPARIPTHAAHRRAPPAPSAVDGATAARRSGGTARRSRRGGGRARGGRLLRRSLALGDASSCGGHGRRRDKRPAQAVRQGQGGRGPQLRDRGRARHRLPRAERRRARARRCARCSGSSQPTGGHGHRSAAAATRSSTGRAATSAPCSRTRPSTPGAPRATTCACWPPPASTRRAASTRCWRPLA